MPLKTRVSAVNTEDSLQANFLKRLLEVSDDYSRIFYFGQVINNKDASNLNRIQVRVPLLDDLFYINTDKNGGDSNLPYCLPISSRFIETPEVNSIVVVGIFDPNVPYYGRIYFDCLTGLSSKDLFDQLTPEQQALSDWLNAEDSISAIITKPTSNNEFNAKENIKYDVGIRGKGNNKLQLNKTTTNLAQNEGDSDKESFLNLDINTTLESANELHLSSKKGDDEEYNVVFDDKLFDYMDSLIAFFQKVVTTFATTPAISPVGPCSPSAQGIKLASDLSKLKKQLQLFKQTGSSKKIYVN